MVQHNFAQGLHTSKPRYTLLAQGLGLLSGISLLGNGLGVAQTTIPETTESAAATAQPVETYTAPSVATPVAPPPMPETFPTEFAPPPAAPEPITPMPAPVQQPPAIAPEASSYDAPSTIIFSERSTGCQAVAPSGQAPNGLCGGAVAASSGGAVGGGSVRSLASQPSVSPSSVRIGPLNVPASIAPPTSLPSLKDYYRRTVRPPSQLGNGNIRLIFPLSIPAPISSLFGWRLHPITGDARFHMGTDLAAPLGTPVLAAYAGQVAIADFLGGYGLTVALDHNNNTQQTLYAHLSEVFVKAGDMVKQGDVIGRVGSTGNSTGPHLHFEFRQLTPDGWVALDAGAQLEYALAQLVSSMEIAQATSTPAKANAGVQGVIQ